MRLEIFISYILWFPNLRLTWWQTFPSPAWRWQRGCGAMRRGVLWNAVYLRRSTANQFSFYYRLNNASLLLLGLYVVCFTLHLRVQLFRCFLLNKRGGRADMRNGFKTFESIVSGSTSRYELCHDVIYCM